MEAEGDARMIADHYIIHFDGKIKQMVGIAAALAITFAQLRVEQRGVLR